jgi:hypothetical protein
MKMTMDRLSKAGYQVIAIPDTALTPWTIIDGDTEKFKSYGPIWKFTKESDRPEINQDITGPGVLLEACDDVIEAKAGFSILGYLGLKGANFSSEYKNAHTIRIVYSSILKDAIDLIDLSKFVVTHVPEKAFLARGLFEALDEKGEAAIIFETLKSNEINFVAYNEKGVEIKVDADMEVATAKGEFKISAMNANTLCYKGVKPLVFAYQALPFWINEENAGYQFNFSVKEEVEATIGGYPVLGGGDSGVHGMKGDGRYMTGGGGTHRTVSRNQKRTITPEYVKSLEDMGLLEKQFKTVFKPDYKMYSPNTMIKRVS